MSVAVRASGPELQISVRTIRDRIRPCSRARAARGSRDRDDFVRNSRIPKRAPRAGAGAVRSRARRARTPAPARTGEARSKPGRRAASQPSMEPVETSGPSRHTVSSHAPGAGRGKPLSVRMTRRRRGFTRHDADEGGGTYVHVARFSVTTTRRDDTHTGTALAVNHLKPEGLITKF